jgi:hypothetical protein
VNSILVIGSLICLPLPPDSHLAHSYSFVLPDQINATVGLSKGMKSLSIDVEF